LKEEGLITIICFKGYGDPASIYIHDLYQGTVFFISKGNSKKDTAFFHYSYVSTDIESKLPKDFQQILRYIRKLSLKQ
jgi:hypothetical protein